MLKIKRKSSKTSEMSLASMSDIAFLLIIFFMISSAFIIKDGIRLVLPDLQKQPVLVSKNSIIRVSIKKNNDVFINDIIILDENIITMIKDMQKADEKYVLLEVDKKVSYKRTIKVLDYIRTCNIKKISIKAI